MIMMLTYARLTEWQVRKIPTHELSRVNPPSYEGSEEIADLTYLNEASVVHNLKIRYLDNSIYVSLDCPATTNQRKLI